jgi:hypothetical protein
MRYYRLIILLVLAAFLDSTSLLISYGKNVVSAQYPVIDGIKCDKTEHFNFHYHAHLSIFINGSSYVVPGGIGIKPPNCIYWLHTHDDSGLIHIESPQNNTFNLGQFFDIWGQKFNGTKLSGFKVDNSSNRSLTVYLNGTAVNESSFSKIPVLNHEDIVVAYGLPRPEIRPYEFPY